MNLYWRHLAGVKNQPGWGEIGGVPQIGYALGMSVAPDASHQLFIADYWWEAAHRTDPASRIRSFNMRTAEFTNVCVIPTGYSTYDVETTPDWIVVTTGTLGGWTDDLSTALESDRADAQWSDQYQCWIVNGRGQKVFIFDRNGQLITYLDLWPPTMAEWSFSSSAGQITSYPGGETFLVGGLVEYYEHDDGMWATAGWYRVEHSEAGWSWSVDEQVLTWDPVRGQYIGSVLGGEWYHGHVRLGERMWRYTYRRPDGTWSNESVWRSETPGLWNEATAWGYGEWIGPGLKSGSGSRNAWECDRDGSWYQYAFDSDGIIVDEEELGLLGAPMEGNYPVTDRPDSWLVDAARSRVFVVAQDRLWVGYGPKGGWQTRRT